MKNNEKKYIFLITFIVLGVLLSVQFKSTLFTDKKKASTMLDMEQLIGSIQQEKDTENELLQMIEQNIATKESYLKLFLEAQNDEKLKDEWEISRMKAGFTDVKGPGVTILLDDAVARQNENPQLLIIHDQDIKIILNELKMAGAQAISINGERVAPMSEQVCAGPTILINKNRYSVPYVINAIGDAELMYNSIIKSERVVLMMRDKIKVEITIYDDIVVPKYNNNFHNLNNLLSGLEVIKSENQ